MKLLAIVIVIVLAACARPTAPPPAAPAQAAPCPPAAAAGDFKMKSYFLVLLRRGPTWSAEKTEESKRLGEGHMANIRAMGEAGKLVIAGPTDVDASQRDVVAGIFIFDVATREEVDALLKGDPAIAAGRFIPEVLPWYGPAGLTYPGDVRARVSR